jgi:hypothetical protein
MSIDSESFAELTLFLSTDKELQVRAHVTKKGKYVFCVKDFICQTSNRDVGPNESILLWIHAVGKLLHEDHILENIPVQFAGPYEKPCICISAEGLLILYHFLDQEFNLTEIKYRDQVQNVLMDVVSGKNMDSHIYMHDDGEIRELMKEKGDNAYSNPPAGSKFIFIPTVVDVDGNGDEIPVPVYVSKLKDNEKALLEKIRSLEKQNTDLIKQSKKHEQTLSTLEEFKFLKERKRQRKEVYIQFNSLLLAFLFFSFAITGVLCTRSVLLL